MKVGAKAKIVCDVYRVLPAVNELWGKVMFSQVFVHMVWRGSLYDVTFCLAAWSHVPSRGGLCPGTLTEIPLDGDTPRPLDRDPLLCGKEQAVCILLECILLPPRKRSLGQGYIFTPVCHSVHCHSGQVHPQTRYTPRDQVHPLPGPGTPPLWVEVPPRSSACWEIQATSGRYASYWNAFLFFDLSCLTVSAFASTFARYEQVLGLVRNSN